MRFQNSENNITGPKAAPNPAHANETTSNTELFGLSAIIAPIIAITTTVALETHIISLLSAFLRTKPLKKFCDTLDDATSSCESEVDIVAARMPARITPANTNKIKLLPPSFCANTINIVSGSPIFLTTAAPIIPISKAENREMTTHTVAILREVFNSFSLRIAIKRSSTCGIPKYPSPHASVEIIVIKPYGADLPVSGTKLRTMLKNPGIDLAFSTTPSIPPATLMPKNKITTSATDINNP